MASATVRSSVDVDVDVLFIVGHILCVFFCLAFFLLILSVLSSFSIIMLGSLSFLVLHSSHLFRCPFLRCNIISLLACFVVLSSV